MTRTIQPLGTTVTTFGISLPVTLKTRLDLYTRSQDISRSLVISQALERFLEGVESTK